MRRCTPCETNDGDPRAAWARYVLDAQVMCVREPGSTRWVAPSGLTFRNWIRGAASPGPTADDLTYHMTTLFPPVRPQGHLELRVIDAQPGDDGWIVPRRPSGGGGRDGGHRTALRHPG